MEHISSLKRFAFRGKVAPAHPAFQSARELSNDVPLLGGTEPGSALHTQTQTPVTQNALKLIENASLEANPKSSITSAGENAAPIFANYVAPLRTVAGFTLVLGAGYALWLRATVSNELQPVDLGIFLLSLAWTSGVFEKLPAFSLSQNWFNLKLRAVTKKAEESKDAATTGQRVATEAKELAKQTKGTLERTMTILDDQALTLNSVKMFLRTMLSEPEIAHLHILHNAPRTAYKRHANLQQELNRLREIGLIEQRAHNTPLLAELPEEFVLGDYFSLSLEGVAFLKLRTLEAR